MSTEEMEREISRPRLRGSVQSHQRPELFVRSEACEALTFFNPFGLYHVSVIRVSLKGAVLYMFTCMDSKTKLNRSEQSRRSVWFASDVHSDEPPARSRIKHPSSQIPFFAYPIHLHNPP